MLGPRIAQTAVLSFAALIVCGTALLSLPGCSADGARMPLLDALFTSTSAVCVTGLIVLDTGRELSLGGQAAVLGLIQCGGLGFLTLSTLVLLAVRGRVDLRSRVFVEQTHGRSRGLGPMQVLRRVVGLTIGLEALGALLLFAAFAGSDHYGGATGAAAWSALFHAVSAFCNAGFSLHSDSLTRFADQPFVLGVLMVLITAGGLGFLVLAELGRMVKGDGEPRRWWKLSLHTRLVVLTSLVLLAGGTLLFTTFETSAALAGTSPGGHLLAPLFMAVTCRTAGFNTLDVGSLTGASLILALLLMAVGASPGSTGGGIKTTTVACLFAAGWSRLRGRSHAEILGRRIPGDLVAKAIATVAAFVVIVFASGLILQVTEVGLLPHDAGSDHYLDHLFEIISALATVGLSTGVTPTLSPAGRVLIIALMFLGRLGPLVVGASLIGERRPLPMDYPEERILLG